MEKVCPVCEKKFCVTRLRGRQVMLELARRTGQIEGIYVFLSGSPAAKLESWVTSLARD